jgi:prepilin-type N-terminal cleavage/methylation domain-containing protein
MIWKRFYIIGISPAAASRRQSRPAFSLIEVLISVALFAVIILSSTQIFKMVIDSQRNALATQNVQDSLKYFLEVTAKEMRMAQKNKGVCAGIPAEEIFIITATTTGQILSFKNYYNQCVSYFLAPDTVTTTTKRFKITRSALADFISPNKINLDSLNFILSAATTTQPLVTINITAHALNEAQFKSSLIIQTGVSSRYYK